MYVLGLRISSPLASLIASPGQIGPICLCFYYWLVHMLERVLESAKLFSCGA